MKLDEYARQDALGLAGLVARGETSLETAVERARVGSTVTQEVNANEARAVNEHAVLQVAVSGQLPFLGS